MNDLQHAVTSSYQKLAASGAIEQMIEKDYECEIHFGISNDTGRIFGLRLQGKEVEKTLFLGGIYNFERSLFQMYAAATRVVMDGESVDDFGTHYPGHDD